MILRVETEGQDRFFQANIVRITEKQITVEQAEASMSLTFTREAGSKVTFNFMSNTGKRWRDSVVWR